ncbi:respiratory nitrate reductase subunit alpha [Escherichia coli]
MIGGGDAHLAYGFNYYGTVGSNRDEFVVVRKMKSIDWLDGEGNDQVQERAKLKLLTSRHGAESR